jgi:regulatory protein
VPKRQKRTPEALEVALRALDHRDRSSAELAERLDRHGITADERNDALARLTSSGVIDDGRFAVARAASLASRGYGDAAIDDDLRRRGIDPALRADAIAALESETERALALVRRRGASARTARFLAARGFEQESAGAALGAAFAPDP